ncbi:Armadillo repeat-containing protein 4, partial [Irineochytrium annulatum]
MGATLSSLLQWGGAGEGPSPSSSGSIQTSIGNQGLLHELIHFIEALASQHPLETRAEFRRQLVWQTVSLRPSHFSQQPSGVWTVVPFGPKNPKASVSSIATRSDGVPLFQLEQLGPATGDGATFVAKVASFEYLNRVLQIAEEMKLRELQDILQANPAPISIIFGTTGTSTNTIMMEAFEACSTELDAKRRDQNFKLYKLLLILNSFDIECLSAAVKTQQREKHLDMQKVSSEVQMLQSFCGSDPKCALTSIDWESDYIFSNGCRAPPWRQVYGEICYLEIICQDTDRFIVTASKGGYFVNKGYSSDNRGNEKLNYERASDSTYPTLIDLLKVLSPHFLSTIDHQDYLYQPDSVLDPALSSSAADKLLDDQAHQGNGADGSGSDGEGGNGGGG